MVAVFNMEYTEKIVGHLGTRGFARGMQHTVDLDIDMTEVENVYCTPKHEVAGVTKHIHLRNGEDNGYGICHENVSPRPEFERKADAGVVKNGKSFELLVK